jgi:hypothetical protein
MFAALGACDDGSPTDGDADADVDADADADDDFMGDPCLDRGRFVYLLDLQRKLLRLEPGELRIQEVGTLTCDPARSPVSMSVDRDGVAWVLYEDGRLYHVSTRDATCTPTSFVPGQQGFEVFGMGFVSLTAGSDEETLYVAGGAWDDFVPGGAARLGRVDPASLSLAPIGALTGWPELTGTGAGELWAFYPDSTPAAVVQLDRETAAPLRAFALDGVDTTDFSNWAFAFWGGQLHVFIQRQQDASTSLWRLDPATGAVTEALHETGYSIVGAGVSTCAPLEIL